MKANEKKIENISINGTEHTMDLTQILSLKFPNSWPMLWHAEQAET